MYIGTHIFPLVSGSKLSGFCTVTQKVLIVLCICFTSSLLS